MSARAARFEVVRGDAGQPWHARFIAANGRIVWTSETYKRRAGAENAVVSIARELGCGDVVLSSLRQIPGDNHSHRWVTSDGASTEIRYLDERGRIPDAPYTITSGTRFLVGPPISTTWNGLR